MSINRIPRTAEFIELLTDRLPQKTLAHSISVAEHMLDFATEAGITQDQAVTAGLLHDLCKPMKAPELIEAATRYGIEPTALQLDKPTLLHGPVAAEECRRDLGIDDPLVYEAIFWHTTGRDHWNDVGLALYLADFSEPLRTLPQATQALALLHEDGFKAALRFAVRSKRAYVAKKFSVDPMTDTFFQWLERDWA